MNRGVSNARLNKADTVEYKSDLKKEHGIYDRNYRNQQLSPTSSNNIENHEYSRNKIFKSSNLNAADGEYHRSIQLPIFNPIHNEFTSFQNLAAHPRGARYVMYKPKYNSYQRT